MEFRHEEDGSRFLQVKFLAVKDEVRVKHETVLITKHGKPVAKLVPVNAERTEIYNFLAGEGSIAGDIVPSLAEGYQRKPVRQAQEQAASGRIQIPAWAARPRRPGKTNVGTTDRRRRDPQRGQRQRTCSHRHGLLVSRRVVSAPSSNGTFTFTFISGAELYTP
jgi:antitoxin (DNA-binding transcriptional repressor) of toxin-antitoxin stability system